MPLNALRLKIRPKHVAAEVVNTEMGTVKRSVSEGDRVALVHHKQENVKIGKDNEPGCTSQESCRQA